MCPGLTYCVTHDNIVFLMLHPDIIQFGRITLDVINASQRNAILPLPTMPFKTIHVLRLIDEHKWGEKLGAASPSPLRFGCVQ